MTDGSSAKAILESKLAELRARLAHVRRDLADPLDDDFEELAVEAEDDLVLQGEAVLIDSEIASVERALDRMARGTYGQCVRCGGKIGAARLMARPEASLCIDCASAGDS